MGYCSYNNLIHDFEDLIWYGSYLETLSAQAHFIRGQLTGPTTTDRHSTQ
jgi:hypothetical protein